MIHNVGATALIPFKENSVRSTPNHRVDPVWAERFDHWKDNPDDFDAHYHQRSNVESAFSAIKRKFGGWVRSKTPVAQCNEVLAKILAFNITELVQQKYGQGLKIDFPMDGTAPRWGHTRIQSDLFEDAA